MMEAISMLSTTASASDTYGSKFFDTSSAQALAFAVAALQAMPLSSSVEPTLGPNSTTMVPSTTRVPLSVEAKAIMTSDSSDVSKPWNEEEEESLVTEQSAGSGTREDAIAISGAPVTVNMSTSDFASANNNNASSVKEEESGDMDDASTRLQRSRERNREHARRTRLRKKAQLQALQGKYKGMLAEKQALEQKLQDRSIASILLGLSTTSSNTNDEDVPPSLEADMDLSLLQRQNDPETTSTTRRKRGSPEISAPVASLTVSIDGVPTALSFKSHINWKLGTYCDEQGRQKQLTLEQLETLRRERNRMHAKMTRDRKKCFISTMEHAIEELEQELSRLRSSLGPEDDVSEQASRKDEIIASNDINEIVSSNVVQEVASSMVTPELTALPSPDDTPSGCVEGLLVLVESSHEVSAKRVCHGFSLDG